MMQDGFFRQNTGIVESVDRAFAELFDHLIVFLGRFDGVDLKRHAMLDRERVRFLHDVERRRVEGVRRH